MHLTSITGVPGDDRLLFAANPRQVFKSADSGLTWKSLTIAALQVDTVTSHPVHSTRKGAALARPRPVGHTINPNEFRSLTAITSGTQAVLLAATNRGLLRSSDKGVTWIVARTGYADNFDAIYTVAYQRRTSRRPFSRRYLFLKRLWGQLEPDSFPIPPGPAHRFCGSPGRNFLTHARRD